MGTLLSNMWQSLMLRFSHQLTSSLSQLDRLTIFLAELTLPLLCFSTIPWISLDLALVNVTTGLEEMTHPISLWICLTTTLGLDRISWQRVLMFYNFSSGSSHVILTVSHRQPKKKK